MNKIKVIDLLNMISKDEDVPKRIKYCGVNYKYDVYDYFNEDEDDVDDEPLSSWIDFSKKDLNDEVEIIEDTPKEDKKIDKLEKLHPVSNKKQQMNNYILRDKINEIIDKVNGDK